MKSERNEDRRVVFPNASRGTKAPIAPEHAIEDQRLNAQQRAAVTHVLRSTDGIIMIRGGAGTGKTTLMSEAVGAINRSWLRNKMAGEQVVTVLAPTSDAGRDVLRRAGFTRADTVAKFLHDEKMQQQATGGVLWIDEAGLLGCRTMAQVVETASRIKARIILSGEERPVPCHRARRSAAVVQGLRRHRTGPCPADPATKRVIPGGGGASWPW